jgi:uroporphyrinogen-III synthase
VARARGLDDALCDGLSNTVVAAVSPVAADEARRAGMNPTIMPARVHAMKTLVNEITRAMQAGS